MTLVLAILLESLVRNINFFMAQYSILLFFLSISFVNNTFNKGLPLLSLTDEPYKKLLICVQSKVIYDDRIYFWKVLTLK